MKDFSHAVASALARSEPRLYVDVASKSRRAGRIFVDYLRNARGATAVAAYSTRANPRATVSTPIHWKALESGARADGFTVPDVERRLVRGFRDPWARFESARSSLSAAKRRALGP